jgi:hypothetical protein
MEQRVLIKDRREDGHGSTQIPSRFVKYHGDTAVSYPDVSYCVRHVRTGPESFDVWGRSGKPRDFETHFRIQGALEASPNASVRDIAETTGIAPSTVFDALTQVFHLKFGNWRWNSHKLSDDEKRARVQLAVSLQAEHEKAQRRNWTEFYTGNESWSLGANFPKGY